MPPKLTLATFTFADAGSNGIVLHDVTGDGRADFHLLSPQAYPLNPVTPISPGSVFLWPATSTNLEEPARLEDANSVRLTE